MTTTYVVVDVETTGLSADNDAMVEVAAVTLRDDQVIDEFSSLINPQVALPPFITQLTGITQKMVDMAPSLSALRMQIRRIFGDHVLVGHNIGFDLGFLQAERLGIGQKTLDTVTLASILVPEAGRYNLESLAQFLRLPSFNGRQTHRALDDARQTADLFLYLKQRALECDPNLIEEIVQAGQRISWPETLFFHEIYGEQARHAFERPLTGRPTHLYQPPKLSGKPLIPVEEVEPVDVDIVAGMIRPGGNFDRAFPGFEHRPQQVQMMVAVGMALNESKHLLVEAGTGTGKSVGYLLPAAFWAHQNGRRVVISTNTINLQDQLIGKDVPDLQKVLPFEIRAAIRKGRSNYICTRLFQQMRHTGPNSGDEMALYSRILFWLKHTDSGDVAELSLRTPGERLAWTRLSGESGDCTLEMCAQEECPLHIARRRAELAHLVVVNHALLLSDVANNNHILPEFKDLIIDEAHHLETAVTDGLSFEADKRYLEVILEEITRPRAGLLADLQSRARSALPKEISDVIDGFADKLRREGMYALGCLGEFFDALYYFTQAHVNRRSQFPEDVRLVPTLRQTTEYQQVTVTWENLNIYLKGVSAGFTKLVGALDDILAAHDLDEGETLRLALQSNGRLLEDTRQQLHALVAEPSASMIYWIESVRDQLTLHAAPLHVGPLVEQHLFEAKECVILTSATMRTAGPKSGNKADFNYIRDRLHAHTAEELAVGSPFDYKNSTLLYLPTDIPEPNQPGYQKYLEEAIVDVAKALGGRTMVLFTAYGQLSQTMRAIEGDLAEAGITLLSQLPGSSRQQLLEQFKRPDSRAVLLGTRSFWEGVDVPGDALQALLITKFPFDVPTDPIFAARSELFENPFMEYSIPEAILRFRQGFGRLVRRQSDEGVVVILDKRVITKRYGQLFMDALPECMVLRQRIGRLGELTLRWLNRDKTQSF